VEITNELLRSVIAGKPVGDHEAYKNGSKNAIKGHIKATVHDLEQSKNLVIETEDSYGSGYASYIDVFCCKSGGRLSTTESGRTTIDGIAIYLCKLAPVAVMGAMEKTRSKGSGSYGFLHAEDLNTFPPGNWLEVDIEIRQKLEKHGFEILGPRELKKTMPFTARIDTNIGDPPYTIFDAFFHWMD
jgi:hypothetical protein